MSHKHILSFLDKLSSDVDAGIVLSDEDIAFLQLIKDKATRLKYQSISKEYTNGDRTKSIAERHGITPGRVSQICIAQRAIMDLEFHRIPRGRDL